ncbi:MAG: YlxR family protein [Clostridia bacterium]|nr:YlxR family protein [Clostridia bacterium]
MKVRRVPQRTCVGCGKQAAKRSLVRIVRTPAGEVLVDATGRRNGRGAYVCGPACLEKALSGRLAHALERELGPDEAERLRRDVAALAAGAPREAGGHG